MSFQVLPLGESGATPLWTGRLPVDGRVSQLSLAEAWQSCLEEEFVALHSLNQETGHLKGGQVCLRLHLQEKFHLL